MFRLVGVVIACAVLAACGSSVKLDAPVVEDRVGTVVSGEQRPAQGGGQEGVASAGVQGSAVNGSVLSDSAADVFVNSAARVVFFDYDSYSVRQEFQALVEAHAKFLKANPGRKVVLEGHTDERGGREYNISLGQKRAEAVRRVMLLLGVTDAQVEAVSFGKEKPAAQGDSEEALAKNRRVEIAYR